MTPGQFSKLLAKTLGITDAAASIIDRTLAEQGLRTRAGRGPSAPGITVDDAARLLIAAMTTPTLKQADKTVLAWEHTISLGRPHETPKPFTWFAHQTHSIPLISAIKELIRIPWHEAPEFKCTLTLGVEQMIGILEVDRNGKTTFFVEFATPQRGQDLAADLYRRGDLTHQSIVTDTTFRALHVAQVVRANGGVEE